MLQVLIPFVGHGFNMPAPGTLIDPPEAVAAHLVEIGVAAFYETKVDPLPDEVKATPKKAAKKSTGSSRPARAPAKKTRRKSAKSATK